MWLYALAVEGAHNQLLIKKTEKTAYSHVYLWVCFYTQLVTFDVVYVSFARKAGHKKCE